MYELEKVRKDIDQIDDQLIKLLNERMELSLKVKEIKSRTKMDVLDQSREEAIKQKILDYKCSELFKDKLLSIYQTIFITSKELQKDSE